jgi:predicted O-methyltransferase YrrM
MIDTDNMNLPSVLQGITATTEALEFTMASDMLMGSLLRTLAASKPAGRFLELGTGTGLSAAWLLDGMDDRSTLVTVDDDPEVTAVAERFLGRDQRLSIRTMDGGDFIRTLRAEGRRFDFIFADTWPGKFSLLEETLELLEVGGLYVIDDMLPQDDWPSGHDRKVRDLLGMLEQRDDLWLTKMNWSSGVVVAVRKG